MKACLLVALLVVAPAWAQVPVSVRPVGELLVDLENRASAEVQPLNDATLAAEVGAVVRTVHADIGQQVSAGDLLVTLDETDFRLGLRRAEASLASSRAQKAQADAKLRRARDLIENQYLSADTLLDRETDVQVLNARIQADEVAVATAQRNLDKCRIVAPFDGVIIERLAQVGGYVAPGSPLLQITQIDRFELDAAIPAAMADTLPAARDIRFVSNAKAWPVDLLRLSPVIEPSQRTRRARFTFTGAAPAVGRSGEVVWYSARSVLPAALVSRRNGALGVFVHVDGFAEFRELPGAQEGRPVPVRLPPDSEVITLGRDRLQDGDPVQVSR